MVSTLILSLAYLRFGSVHFGIKNSSIFSRLGEFIPQCDMVEIRQCGEGINLHILLIVNMLATCRLLYHLLELENIADGSIVFGFVWVNCR